MRRLPRSMPTTVGPSIAVSRAGLLGTVPSRVAISAIRLYQLVFSQLFTGSCRFVPSCSAYAAEAVERHGAARGLWLAARRLVRCHPLCQGGLDQVPMPHTETEVGTPPVG